MTQPETPRTGEKAPDFTALTSKSEEFKLSRVLDQGNNVALLFYRGHW